MSKSKEPDKMRKFVDDNIRPFLTNNGFEKYANFAYLNYKTNCMVLIEKNGYEVSDANGSIFHDGFDIYWLIGVLTYYGFIGKNYKTNNKKIGF